MDTDICASLAISRNTHAAIIAASPFVCVYVFYAGIVQIGGESVCPVDASGKFTEEITDFAGQ